jgi:hypothetical protein
VCISPVLKFPFLVGLILSICPTVVFKHLDVEADPYWSMRALYGTILKPQSTVPS